MRTHSTSAQANPHWTWHVLIAAAILFLGTAALLYQLQPAHQQLAPARQHLLATICIIAGVACLVPWSLRRVLSHDWRTALARRSHRATPQAHELIPTVVPRQLRTGLWLVLALWMTWVTWSLTINDRLAARLTLENGLLQDLTVLCYAAAAILLFRLVLPALSPNAVSNVRRWWLLTLTLGCLGVAGEEINWGQSVLPYETPEFLARTNIQQEVSLHNLELPGLPGRHWSNDVLWGVSLLGGIVIPIFLSVSRQFRRLIWIAEIPLPPWISQGYFLAAAVIPRDGNMLGRLNRDNIPSELREVTIALAMLIWAWAVWRQRSATPAGPADHIRRDGERDETRIQPA
jgi:hypothetical protein